MPEIWLKRLVSKRFIKSFGVYFWALLFFHFYLIIPFFVEAKEIIGKKKQSSLPAVLKADSVDANEKDGLIKAIGNVELKKDNNIIFANEMSYNQKSKIINANGNVRIKNYQLGRVFADHAFVRDDLTIGEFNDASIVFSDGSYIRSPKINRVEGSKTIFERPIFSLCPNPDLDQETKPDFSSLELISIKSKLTTIDQQENVIKSKDSFLRFFNVPVFYLPYLKTALPSKERESGFLPPSYIKTHKLGLGLKMPYYFNIAPNKDLTTSLAFYPLNNNLIISNDYRHLLKQGSYSVNLELANNNLKNNNQIIYTNQFSKPSNQSVRWYLKSKGGLDFSENSGIDFLINNVGDKNYLRDYHNSFAGYSISKINLDYIKDHDYHSIQTVKVQQLGIYEDSKKEPIALPIINSYLESKPQRGIFNQKYSLLTNFTSITRKTGMQYRRLSLTPEIRVPYGLMGNLFEFKANVQGDLYNVSNDSPQDHESKQYNKFQSNYRPEASFSWNLPLVKELKSGSIIIEPMAKLVLSSYKENYSLIPNEDSTSTELTAVNLFLNDRFLGFDRNESGKMFNYGAKSSFFNSLGQFSLFLGQGYRKSDKIQDVKIIGFNNSNRSNIVGRFDYKAKKTFSINYNFQLSESNYDNVVNQVTSNLDFKSFNLSASYILLKKTVNNPIRTEQSNLLATIKINDKLSLSSTVYYDFTLSKFISNKYEIIYNGCCVISSFSITEYSPANFTKPQTSYNINFAIKNL